MQLHHKVVKSKVGNLSKALDDIWHLVHTMMVCYINNVCLVMSLRENVHWDAFLSTRLLKIYDVKHRPRAKCPLSSAPSPALPEPRASGWPHPQRAHRGQLILLDQPRELPSPRPCTRGLCPSGSTVTILKFLSFAPPPPRHTWSGLAWLLCEASPR